MTLYCWMRLDSRLTTSCRENFLGSVWCLYWYCWAGSEPRNEEDLLETDLLWWVVVMFVSCWWHETWTLSIAPWADLMSSPHDKLLTFYFRLYTQQSESKEKYQVGSAYFVKFETRWIGHLEGTVTWLLRVWLPDCMKCLCIIWIFPWVWCLKLVTRRWLTPDIILICCSPNINSVATWWLNNNIQYFIMRIINCVCHL